MPFLLDEPELISRAQSQNASGEITTHGLRGTRGMEYGPVPLLFYRALIVVTQNPLVWVWIKTFLITSVTLLSVFWLFSLFPAFPRSATLIPFLSPYLWFYARDLWDNSLNIAATALLFVAYLAFTREKKVWMLALAFVCGLLAFLIHLMALPILLGIGLHFVIFEKEWISRNKLWIALASVIAVAASFGYLWHLAHAPIEPNRFTFRLSSFFFALYGSRLLSALALEYFYGPWWFLQGGGLLSVLGGVAVAVTVFVFLPTFYGMYRLARVAVARKRGPEDDLAFLVTLIFLLHLGLCGINQLISHPHYYGGVWFVFYVFYCFGMQGLIQRPRWRLAQAVYLVGLGASLAVIISQIHANQGNRQLHFGSTLSNLMQVAAELSCYPVSIPVVDERPFSFLGFRSALAPSVHCPQAAQEGVRELRIRYRHLEDPKNGELVLEPRK